MEYILSNELQIERLKSTERQIRFAKDKFDDTHFIVTTKERDGDRQVIGHIYSDEDGYEYFATDADGWGLFPPTTDFNAIAIQFDRHARILATEKAFNEINTEKEQSNNLSILNLNQMKNSNNTPAKGKKENQLVFVEYEKPTKEGHLITVVDSYHNTIGRIHRSYNEQTKKYEFAAYDHAGKPLYMTSEKVWELKNQFTDNRAQLLEDAHQRRIESKENSRAKSSEKETLKPEEKKGADKKIDIAKATDEKSHQGKTENPEPKGVQVDDDDLEPELTDEEQRELREFELESLRENESGKENRGLDR